MAPILGVLDGLAPSKGYHNKYPKHPRFHRSLVGGAWAYYQFVRFRLLKPKVEFSFDFERSATINQNCIVAILRTKLCNKGNTKIDLRKDGTSRCHLKYGIIATSGPGKIVSVISKSSKHLERIDNVFVAHRWIEPNETIDDVKIIKLPLEDSGMIQLEIELFGYWSSRFREHKVKWSSSTAFQLAGDVAIASFASEDEQDEYEEEEAEIASIRTNLHKIKVKLESSELSLSEELDELISRAHSLLSDSLRKKRPLGDLDKLIKDLGKYLD